MFAARKVAVSNPTTIATIASAGPQGSKIWAPLGHDNKENRIPVVPL